MCCHVGPTLSVTRGERARERARENTRRGRLGAAAFVGLLFLGPRESGIGRARTSPERAQVFEEGSYTTPGGDMAVRARHSRRSGLPPPAPVAPQAHASHHVCSRIRALAPCCRGHGMAWRQSCTAAGHGGRGRVSPRRKEGRRARAGIARGASIVAHCARRTACVALVGMQRCSLGRRS